MYRFVVNIVLFICFALPLFGEEDVLLRIDSTFYYPEAPKELLAEITESWLHSRKDMASAFVEKHVETDRIIFTGNQDSFRDYVKIKNIFLASGSNFLNYGFQIAIRDGVVRIWFTDFGYCQMTSYPVFYLCEKRPSKLKNIYKPLYKPVYKFAMKRYPERIASLHAALDEALLEPEPLWPSYYK